MEALLKIRFSRCQLGLDRNMTLRFFLRVPKFPVICDIDGELIVAASVNDFERKIESIELKEDGHYTVIDSAVEGWSLSSEPLVVSPLTLKKNWTKMELLNLYNESRNCKRNGNSYPTSSLSNKKLSVIFREITEALSSP